MSAGSVFFLLLLWLLEIVNVLNMKTWITGFISFNKC